MRSPDEIALELECAGICDDNEESILYAKYKHKMLNTILKLLREKIPPDLDYKKALKYKLRGMEYAMNWVMETEGYEYKEELIRPLTQVREFWTEVDSS